MESPIPEEALGTRRATLANLVLPPPPSRRHGRAKSAKKRAKSAGLPVSNMENLLHAKFRAYVKADTQKLVAQPKPRPKSSLTLAEQLEQEYLEGISLVAMPQDPDRPKTQWELFEDHVRHIPTESAEPTPNHLIVKNSETFQRVISDLRYKTPIPTRQRSTSSMASTRASQDLRNGSCDIDENASDSEFSDEDEEEEIVLTFGPARPRTGKNRWNMLKQALQEIQDEGALEKGSSGATLNWNFIRHTVGQLSDVDKARRDLYDRYLVKPNAWVDQLNNKTLAEQLIQKHRSAAKGDPIRSTKYSWTKMRPATAPVEKVTAKRRPQTGTKRSKSGRASAMV